MKTTNYAKPLPTVDDNNRHFWEAAREGRLTLQICTDCNHLRYPLNHVCPVCLSDKFSWRAMSGKATVYSSIVFHQVYDQAFSADVPYNVSLIQLDEGPRMFSNVVGPAPSDVKVGDKLQVFFDPVTDDISIPRFKPV